MKGKLILKISLTIAMIMSFVGFMLGEMVNPNWLTLIFAAVLGMCIVMIWLPI